MTNLENVLKSKDITLLTKASMVKTIAFPVVTYSCESTYDHKEGRALKNRCFQTMVLEKTLESPLDSKEINQSKEIKAINLKGNQP